MKVSLNWIQFINDQYACSADPAPDGVDKLVERIGRQLGAVEEVIELGKKYEGILVAKVVSCEKHPNADKLSVCMIDVGTGKPIQVVCGAPNVREGQLVAWIPPGVAVPSSLDKDPFVLEAREIRGQMSNGMLASPKELDLGDSHDGILVIDEKAQPGMAFAKVYGLDDYIIDIENKMFTHRPDLFGQLGVARELAGIQGHVFKSPSWYRHDTKVRAGNSKDTHQLSIKNEIPKLVPRFTAVVLKEIKVGPSPTWLQTKLARVGVKSINNIVDLTNYYMLETAQPLHAYDYDKVGAGGKQATLGVRMSKAGEQLELLGGKRIKLNEGAIVITDGKKPIGLGGVMGGATTEVGENTKNIILEVANFDMNTTRKTAMSYGLFTEAATRFTKGQSPLQTGAVMSKAVEDIQKIAGGRVVGSMYDDNHLPAEVLRQGTVHPPVKVSIDFINSRLGLNLTEKQIARILQNVEFEIEASGHQLTVKAPFWRTDIEIPEDVVEEVGRLYGYDHLPLELPRRDLSPEAPDSMLAFKNRLRGILSSAGSNEVLTYSFVHGSLIERSGQDKAKAHRIRNAISPDLQYYRLSMTPSLLEKVHPNIKAGYKNFAVYELGKVYVKGVDDKEKLPAELERLALVVASKEESTSTSYYWAKKYLEHLLLNGLSIGNFKYVTLTQVNELPVEWQQTAKSYETKRSAAIYSGKELIGLVGEPIASLKSTLKLPKTAAQFELDVKLLKDLSAEMNPYYPLSRFPSLEQDITLKVEAGLVYGELTDFIMKRASSLAEEKGYQLMWKPLGIYQPENDIKHKQITWRVIMTHTGRTLTTEETNQLLEELSKEAKAKFGALRV